MDLSEFEKIASDRWSQTESAPSISIISEMVLAMPENAGWSIASIYDYSCYEGHRDYPVIIWRNHGVKNGFALVQIRGLLVQYDEKSDTYSLKNIIKIL